MADIECPSCGTQLRNAQAGPDGHIRCPNCGKRFALGAPSVSPEASGAAPAVPSPNVPPGREPAAGHYGLVVVFGYVLLAWLVLSGLLAARDLYPHAGSTAWSGKEDYLGRILMVFGAVTGLPFLGAACLRAARMLAQTEAIALRNAWRARVLGDPLPPLKGSSLPYILPFTVAGGLHLFLALMALDRRDGRPVDALGFSWTFLLGATVALLGLALGEARRFFWRMEQAALRLAGPATPASSARIAEASLSGAWGMVLAGCTACILYRFGSYYLNMTNVEVAVWIGWAFFLSGGACSLWWLSFDGLRAASAWHRVAGSASALPTFHEAWPWRRMRFDKTGAFALLAAAWAVCALAVCYRMVAYDTFKYYNLVYAQAVLLFPAAVLAALLAWSAIGLRHLSETLRAWAGSDAPPARALPNAGPVFWLGLAFLFGALNRKGPPFTDDSYFTHVAIAATGCVLPALWAALAAQRLEEIARCLSKLEQPAAREGSQS